MSNWRMVVVSLGLAWLFYSLKTDEDGFVFLDYVNLAFHEAGHPIFGIFGETLGWYGGTLGQLVMPGLAWLAFWRQRDTIGCVVTGVWFFENFLNIARYMADARAQVLPLAGGGEHDWTNIFSRWGVLMSDQAIAHRVSILGWIGMLAIHAWLAWRWLQTRNLAQE
ncbi:MAG: hypothetical protein ACT4OO_06860 [Nitrospiraceae bacterium]